MSAGSSLRIRLCGLKAHGGSEARRAALGFRRQELVRPTVDPDGDLHDCVVRPGAVSSASAARRGRSTRITRPARATYRSRTKDQETEP